MTEHDDAGTLSGRLLVASPTMADPNFTRTVVFVIHHDERGAVGLVLNRPTRLALDRIPPGWEVSGPVHAGGPVEPEIAIGLVESGDNGAGWEAVGEGLWLADLEGPVTAVTRMRIFSGYAGWGGGQVEAEIARGDWVVAETRRDDVFTEDPEGLWRGVLARQPGAAALLAGYPPNPNLN